VKVPGPLALARDGRRVPQSSVTTTARVEGLSPPVTRRSWSARHRCLLVIGVLLAAIGLVWLVKAVGEYRGVATAKSYWSIPQGQPGGLLYVALGDSTAQGVGASQPERGYVGVLADRMRQQSGRPVMVINLSVTGAKVQDVLDTQVPTLRRLHPDVVTVAIGANDVRSFDAGQFASGMDRLAAQLPSGTFIADVPWFMGGAWEDNAVRAGVDIAQESAARGLVLVPLHRALAQRGWASMLTDFAPDWFHPNDKGYRVWANTFWAVMCPGRITGRPVSQRSPCGLTVNRSTPQQLP
jgi:acyl-CoA thioesterase-1